MTNICVDQVVLNIRALNQEKIPDRHYSKIPDQEFKIYKISQTYSKEQKLIHP